MVKEEAHTVEKENITWDSLSISDPELLITAERSDQLRIRWADAVTSEFYPEDFIKWLPMSRGYAKACCLIDAFYFGGCTALTTALRTGGREWLRVFELATTRLYEEGYFKRVHVRKLGGFYQLSSKGEAIFNNEETRKFLCEYAGVFIDEQEHWETTSNSATAICLQQNALLKMHMLKERYLFNQYNVCQDEDCFLLNFYGALKGKDIAFAGITSQKQAGFEVYREYVTEELEEAKLLIVTGDSKEKTRNIAVWTDLITAADVRVLYTVYNEPEIYDLMTGREVIYEEDFPYVVA